MENKSHAMAAGLFVVALSVLLIGLALWLTRDQRSYETYELSTTDAISGLQAQATVRYKGVAVGKVQSISFDAKQSGNVLIRISVEDSAPVEPTRTVAQLGYQGVTGIAHIQLDDAKEALQPLPSGPSGWPRLHMVSSPLSVLADQGMVILSKVDEATGRINLLLGDGNQQRFSALLENLTQAAGNVAAITATANATLKDQVNPAVAEFPAVAQEARKALQSLDAAAREMQQVATSLQRPQGTLAQLEKGAQSMARAAERFDRSSLPAMTEAAAGVSAAAAALEQTLAGIGDNPQALIYGPGQGQPAPGEPGFVAPAAALP